MVIPDLVIKLIEQLPSAAAILIVVFYFIGYIERRDQSEIEKDNKFFTVLTDLVGHIATISEAQKNHDTSMNNAITEMKNLTTQRRKIE